MKDPVALVLLSVNTFVEVEVELPVLVRLVWLVLLLLEVVVNDPVVLVLLSVNTLRGSRSRATKCWCGLFGSCFCCSKS